MGIRPSFAPLLLVFFVAASSSAQAEEDYGPREGVASWYGAQFQGRRTANGEVFDKEQLTCAHRSLPFGTFLLVRNLDSGSSVVVRVNDRGPFAKNRILDLSEAAARLIGMLPTGTARISFSILPPEEALAWRGGGLTGAEGGQKGTVPLGTVPRKSGTEVWRIQVASYRDGANAQATVARLAAAGLSPEIEKNGVYYRVVFRDLDEPEARRIEARLGALGYRAISVTASRSR